MILRMLAMVAVGALGDVWKDLCRSCYGSWLGKQRSRGQTDIPYTLNPSRRNARMYLDWDSGNMDAMTQDRQGQQKLLPMTI